jgi:hypothetical protein
VEISKSDEVRLQANPDVLNTDRRWTITEKLEGMSATYVLKKKKVGWFTTYEFLVCSRNRRTYEDERAFSVYWEMAKKYDIKKKLMVAMGCYDCICLQGEIVGPKIQKNIYGLSEPDLYLYTVQLDGQKLPYIQAMEFAYTLDMKFVPIVGCRKKLKNKDVESLVELSKGKSRLADVEREGLVFREEKLSAFSKEEYLAHSFKVINPDYLIQHQF